MTYSPTCLPSTAIPASAAASYIAAITSDSGVTLEEFDEGKNSGWMYRVNGELVRRYMSAQGLKDGDRIELYFTSDWTSEPGAEGWQKPGKIETIVNADGSVTKIETKPDGTTVETTTKPRRPDDRRRDEA